MMRVVTGLVTATGLLVALHTAAPRATAPQDQGRIVAIGDVHGASAEFASLLQRTGLIDAQHRWSGGNTTFVQTGDMTDRGTGTKAGLDLLMALEASARGRVRPLLGNHEVMNMLGNLRDATPEIVATFGGDAAMRKAFGPDGRYGGWLRRRPAIAEVDGTIFMHAGINPEYTQDSIDDINRKVRREIDAWDNGVRLLVRRKLVPESPAFQEAIDAARREIERLLKLNEDGKAPADASDTAAALLPVANIASSLLFHAEGPLWFRGFSTWDDAEGQAKVAALLAKYRVKRFVTGHTPQLDGGIRERFAGSLFLIDTGMLDGKYFPGGRPSALELTADGARPIYLR